MPATSKAAAGFAIPQVFPDSDVDLAAIRDTAQRAEQLGFADLWVQEQIVGTSRSLEPVAMLAYLAAVTKTIRLGTSVLVLPVRNPVQLAKALGTVDLLSNGRLTVGVGLGSAGQGAAFGISDERRVRRFLEFVKVMDALWRQPEASFNGQIFQLNATPMEPKPVQKPRPPIWFGARTEPALRRAARFADGWMGPGSTSTADFKAHVAVVRRFLEEEGRDPARFAISKRIYVAIDSDTRRAQRRMRAWIEHHYRRGPELADKVAIWGPAESVYERIDEIIDAGAEHVLLNPVFDYDEHLDALSRYAA